MPDTHALLHALARAGLGIPPIERPPPTNAGHTPLHPHQIEAVRRVQPLLHTHHGALLADDVGLGKTHVALAIAGAYEHVRVIAPAALCHMWRNTIATTHVAPAPIVVSLHRYSSVRPPAPPTDETGRRLIIVDEAHHLRNPATQRFRAVAQCCRGADVLLVSATPVHNRPRDLLTLLSLFLGTHAHALDDAARARLIVRRDASTLQSELAQLGTRPVVVTHHPFPIADAPAVTTALHTLPPPVPSRDGQAAGALVALGLIRAWCSSTAACLSAIQRRRARAVALDAILADNRWPTRQELRAWTVTDDTVQLGFTSLLVGSDPPLRSTQTLAHAREQLARHRAALTQLRHVILTDAAGADRARAERLRAVRARHRGVPIVAFSQLADTVHALGRILRWDSGLAVLTAKGGRVAGGAITRDEVLRRFAPRAYGVAPPPSHERVWLLLTTDLLAEGVNLQDAGAMVHLDLPWTPAAIAQREGRLARLGSQHPRVHVYAMQPPGGGAALLRLSDRLRAKSRAAAVALAADAPDATARRTFALPTMRSATQRRLRHWLTTSPERSTRPADTSFGVCQQTAGRSGWLASAAFPDSDHAVLLGGWFSTTPLRTRVRDDPRTIAQLIATVTHARTASHTLPLPASAAGDRLAMHRMAVLRALERAARDQAASAVVTAMQSPVHRALHHTRDLLRSAPIAQRIAWRTAVAECTRTLRELRGAGDEHALATLLASPHAQTAEWWFAEVACLSSSRGGTERARGQLTAPLLSAMHLHALLLILP